LRFTTEFQASQSRYRGYGTCSLAGLQEYVK
jgi:hypothetical protein